MGVKQSINKSIMFLPYTLLLLLPLILGQEEDSPSLYDPTITSPIRIMPRPCHTDSNTTGTCIKHDECLNRLGTPDGRCAQGMATCCNFKMTCGRNFITNHTILVNNSCPLDDKPSKTGSVTIDKMLNLCQVTLDLIELSPAQTPAHVIGKNDQKCNKDWFAVSTGLEERLAISGKQNNDQVSVDLGSGSGEPVVLSVVTKANTGARKWKLKIKMIPCN